MTGPRVLQVLGDTDRDDPQLHALDLHRALTGMGSEVRTVALGPGRRGGLDAVVPTLAPARRSPAAHTQLRREAAWSDVVVLHGATAATVAALTWRTDPPPLVLALWEESWDWAGSPVPARVVRLLPALAAVVTAGPPGPGLDRLAERIDHPLRTVAVDAGVDAATPAPTPAARDAARRQLGLAPDAAVVRLADRPGRRELRRLTAVAERAGARVLAPGSADEELIDAAADVAVATRVRMAGPSRGLLLAGRSGAALVAAARGAAAGLVDDTTGVPCEGPEDLEHALAGLVRDAAARAGKGAAARARVAERYALGPIAVAWSALLESVLP